jgi:hypothetical protein
VTGTTQPASVVTNITGVPASTLNSVGKGTASATPQGSRPPAGPSRRAGRRRGQPEVASEIQPGQGWCGCRAS